MQSIQDFVKYPFFPNAAEYVKGLGVNIDELDSPIYERIIDRTVERITEALYHAYISKKYVNDNVEILSFPLAIMILSHLSNDFAERKFVLSEAKKAYENLRFERTEKLLKFSGNFGWDMRVFKEYRDDFFLLMSNYLRASVGIKELRWKLVNRLVNRGYVRLSKNEVARLMQEEIASMIRNKINTSTPYLPENLKSTLKRVEKLIKSYSILPEKTNIPSSIVLSAFPPCIKNLYNSVLGGRNISHIERFTLTTFLSTLGFSSEKIVNLFQALPDFDNKKTMYQIEHIMGVRGVKRTYNPPKCEKLRTHGLCKDTDGKCQEVGHPLIYYRRKVVKTIGQKNSN